jgi:hypothetical protein
MNTPLMPDQTDVNPHRWPSAGIATARVDDDWLIKAFMQIKDTKLRRHIVEFVASSSQKEPRSCRFEDHPTVEATAHPFEVDFPIHTDKFQHISVRVGA